MTTLKIDLPASYHRKIGAGEKAVYLFDQVPFFKVRISGSADAMRRLRAQAARLEVLFYASSGDQIHWKDQQAYPLFQAPWIQDGASLHLSLPLHATARDAPVCSVFRLVEGTGRVLAQKRSPGWFAVDQKPPRGEVVVDQAPVQIQAGRAYFRAPFTLQVFLQDDWPLFLGDRAHLIMEGSDGASPLEGRWTPFKGGLRATFTVKEEGHYRIRFPLQDGVGRTSQPPIPPYDFCLDQQKPELKIQGQEKQEGYLVLLQMKEANPDFSSQHFQVRRRTLGDDQALALPSPAFLHHEGIWSARLLFPASGQYTLSWGMMDLAGHRTQAPLFRFHRLAAGQEREAQAGEARLEKEEAGLPAKEKKQAPPNSPGAGAEKKEENPVRRLQDRLEEGTLFEGAPCLPQLGCLFRYGPLLDQIAQRRPFVRRTLPDELTLTLFSPAGLRAEDLRLEARRNGQPYSAYWTKKIRPAPEGGQDGGGPRSKAKAFSAQPGVGQHWSVWVDPACFSREGFYQLVWVARTQDGHTSESVNAWGEDLSFFIDRQPPRIRRVQGLDQTRLRAVAQLVTVDYEDSVGLKRISRTINGQKTTLDLVGQRHYRDRFTLYPSGAPQTILLEAEDLAGNATSTRTRPGQWGGSLCTTIDLKPPRSFWPIALLLFFLLALFAVLFYRKRRQHLHNTSTKL